jgi:2,4-dienoyl-CoA reductase-like NADH-dependent reductase (Old Yellow Enzyme family)
LWEAPGHRARRDESDPRQRAIAGLIIAKGVQPSPAGQAYLNTSGLHTPRQIEGWRDVVDAVHQEGGHIVAQIMHAGRLAHPDNKKHHLAPGPPHLSPRVAKESRRIRRLRHAATFAFLRGLPWH